MAVTITKAQDGDIRERVIAHIRKIREPLLKERDALHAQLNKLIETDGAGQAKIREKLYAINQAGDIFRLDTELAMLARDRNTKRVAGILTLAEQLAKRYGVE